MIYILQHSYKKEYKNFNTEIIGRKDYLYNIFKLYFVIKKTVYLKGNFTLPQYYILESFPFNSMNNIYVVVGDTNFVIEYINTHKEEFNGKTLVIITCVKNNKKKINRLLSTLKCTSIYLTRQNNDEADYYDGSKWGLNFKITLSELDFYNSYKSNIIEKLNYILPAIIFDVGCRYYINIELIPTDNIFISIFIYYFLGLVISRVGSLIIKPLLWKLKVLNKKDSSECVDFYKAEKKDEKIKILFTDYNMYRNFIATFFLLLVSKFAYAVKNWLNINSTIICTILFIFLLVLFVISYKKQLGYIHSRIENTK